MVIEQHILHTTAVSQSPLVGREREIALMRARFEATLTGRGSIVLLSGAAGIGKTALAMALSREAVSRGAQVLIGHCYDRTETPPYGLWLDLFASYRNHDAGVPPAFAQRGTVGAGVPQAVLYNQVLDFLVTCTESGPVVLLLDDLHWADPDSLDLLRFVARATQELPLLVIAVHRSDELVPETPLYQLVPLLVREADAVRLTLTPLADGDIRTYTRARYTLDNQETARLVRHLHARTQGNPFFMTEVLRSMEEEGVLHQTEERWALGDLSGTRVPLLLRQVIDTRLARLGAEARRVLSLAAIIGEEVSLDLWSVVSGMPEETLLDLVERAVRTRILDETADGRSVRFVHTLIREALYEGMIEARRRLIHGQIGREIAARPAPDPDTVASHLARAQDPQAADWLIRAGERAQRSYAYLTAAERYRAALTLFETHGAAPRERGWLQYRLAWISRYTDPHSGLHALADASRLAVECGDAALTAAVCCLRGELRCSTGDFRRGIEDLRAGIAAFATAGMQSEPPALAIDHEDFRGRLAARLAYVGRYREAEAVAADVLHGEQHADAAPNLRLHADAYHALGRVHAAMGRPAEARRAFRHARACFEAIGDHYMTAATIITEVEWSFLPYESERRTEVAALRAEAEAAWTRASTVHGNQHPYLWHLAALAVDGRWEEARDLVRRARSMHPADGSGGRLAGQFGELLYRYGDANEARALIAEMLPDGPATAPGGAWFAAGQVLQRVAALLASDAGDFATARAWLEAHDRWLAWSGGVLGRAEGDRAWTAYHHARGNGACARRYAMQMLADAERPRQPRALLAAHQLLGQFYWEAGQLAEAEQHLDAALALAEAGNAIDHATTLLLLAELHLAAGRRAAAREALDRCIAAATAIGAVATIAQAHALAVRIAGRGAVHPTGLTQREIEVLRLLAMGRSNREIGTALSMSVRTAERHINNIYVKIAARGRAEATAFALRHGLADHPGT